MYGDHLLNRDIAVLSIDGPGQGECCSIPILVTAENHMDAAIAAADWLATHWGGQMVTIPKDYFFKLAARDMKIYHQFNGNNHSELARLHKMSVRGIYKLLDRVHKREIDRRQCRLDLDPDQSN